MTYILGRTSVRQGFFFNTGPTTGGTFNHLLYRPGSGSYCSLPRRHSPECRARPVWRYSVAPHSRTRRLPILTRSFLCARKSFQNKTVADFSTTPYCFCKRLILAPSWSAEISGFSIYYGNYSAGERAFLSRKLKTPRTKPEVVTRPL